MKTFVFDADGVVCIGRNFSHALEAEHGIARGLLAPFFQGPFAECIVGRKDLAQEIAGYLPAWGWRGSVDEFLRFWFEREHVVCLEILGLIRELRASGHYCVLGTNQEKHRAAYLRREMNLGTELDEVYASCELGFAKPSAEFFLGVAARLPARAREICLIDDVEKNVNAARSIGWSAIHYRGPADIEEIRASARE